MLKSKNGELIVFVSGMFAATTLVLSNTVNPATFLRMQKITGSVILAYQYVIQIYIAE